MAMNAWMTMMSKKAAQGIVDIIEAWEPEEE